MTHPFEKKLQTAGLVTPPAPKNKTELSLVPVASGADKTAYAAAALRDECEKVANAAKKTRNHTLNRAAFSLASLVDAGHLTRTEVEDALTDAALIASAKGDHPMTDTEIENTIKSGFTGSGVKVGARAVPNTKPMRPVIAGRINAETWTDTESEKPTGPAPVEPEEPEEAPHTEPTLEKLEQDFWTSRPELNLIYQAALSRMASPWAVLACVTARILYLVPPSITLPPVIGGPGSLNWFAALSAKSGGGKGAAMAATDQLMPNHDIPGKPIGSGEGMIETYQRNRKVLDDDTPPVTSVMFSVDEVDYLGAMGGRSGQTTMSVLRSGFSGEALGFSYRGRQSETVAAHTYRMTLVVSVQPARAGTLFEDAAGGTPQRFMWFPARDKRITEETPEWPTGRNGEPRVLPIMSIRDIAAAVGTIDLPEEVAIEIKRARAASMRGDDNALDGHSLFVREKFAFALAFMNGRTNITLEDWRLATIASGVSDWCRQKAMDGYRGGKESDSRERGQQRAIEKDEQDIRGAAEYEKHVSRIAHVVKKRLLDMGPSTTSEINRKVTSRDRPRLLAALDAALDIGLIHKLEDGKWAAVT